MSWKTENFYILYFISYIELIWNVQELRNELEDRTAKLLQFELNASLSAIDEEQAPEWVFYDGDDDDDGDDGNYFDVDVDNCASSVGVYDAVRKHQQWVSVADCK